MKDKIIGFLSGIAFGMTTTVPGFSGGTMLVICGCYDRVCEALALNFKAIKEHFFYFAVFGIGMIAGLFGFAHAAAYMIEKYPLITYLIFSVLILLGLPVVIKKIKEEKDFSPKCLIPAAMGFILVAGLFTMEMLGITGADKSFNPVMMIIFTALSGVAQIIPGVSGAFVLIIFGAYETAVVAVKELDFSVLVFVVIGIMLGLVGGSRLITFLLKKAKTMVYCAITGMLAASAIMLSIDTIIKYG